MKESYGEGPATHTGPKSCIPVREDRDEALTGERAGPVSSREIDAPPQGGLLRGADAVESSGRPRPGRRHGEALRVPARSETRRMYGSTSHGNREVPRPSAAEGVADRIGKSKDDSR